MWNYYRDERSNLLSSNSESFKYKTIITEKTPENNDLLTNLKLVRTKRYLELLRHLNNFWRSLNIPLIKCEVQLTLTWSRNCVLADMTTRNAQDGNSAIVASSGAKFKITGTKFYVPVYYLHKIIRTIKIRI